MGRRHRNPGRIWLTAAVVTAVVVTGTMVKPTAARANLAVAPDNPCLSAPEDINHANIRLDEPAEGAKVPVDEHGQITISGVLHKQAAMNDVTVGSLVTNQFTFGPPPHDVSDWATSWTTSVRPPHLGSIQLCARAARDPKWQARVLRNITIVDLIPPSNVPNLAIVDITSTSAKVTWDAATDNYGLAGYEITVDGRAPQRTVVGDRSYAITGLAPSSDHSVSVVAVDLAGNRSTTPATTSFTTTAAPPPPNPDTDVVIRAEEGSAVATWHPDPAGDATYQVLLDGVHLASFPLDAYCTDINGNPASPCTAQDTITYPFSHLDQASPYNFQVQALAADGTPARELSTTFTTLTVPPVVPEATTALIASESSQCAALGGSLYVSPSQRGRVPLPAGSTELFTGCYTVPDHSCIDQYLPPSGDKHLDCADDVTRTLSAVAPPGHGPVISSLYDTAAAPAFSPTPVIDEAVAWCTHNTACTTVVEKAEEVVAEEAIRLAAEATSSFFVVVGEGILLGVSLALLYEALFPDPIGFAGLIEYPINYDTNFDTFTNWGEGQGKWINSLKTYAQVIKTTTEVAGEQGLPFAWDAATDHDLRTAIDLACGAAAGRPANVGNVCGDNLTFYVPGGKSYSNRPMPETGKHIMDALGNGIPNPKERSAWFYPAYSKGGAIATSPPNNYPRDWFMLPRFQPNPCDTHVEGDGKACDEFPFFATNQAVDLTLPDRSLVADVRLTPLAESSVQGNDTSAFYRKCLNNYTDGERFVVLPVPSWVAAGAPSFGFKVNQGGASLCMPPKPSTP